MGKMKDPLRSAVWIHAEIIHTVEFLIIHTRASMMRWRY